MKNAVEIEVDGARNECLSFRPLPGRTVRGKFSFDRVAEPMARVKANDWPTPIPGQRIGLDPDGLGFVREPLRDEEFAPIREKIEKQGMKLPPAIETFENIHLPSWLHWMKKAVESGVAKVVSGKLPEKVDGTPRRNFIMAEPPVSSTDKLTAAIDRQSALFEKLLERLSK
ncbi:MAG: hypothetical protein KKA28_05785 [Planctomycetes bacterium]|nr:hypothetical protein [Planctomycetota bacterium]MCG2682895.1 hypothetical protein [Planctomycetales bacterium]